MKRVLFLFAALLCFAGKANAQAEVPHFASDPATCDNTRGLLYYNTTSNQLKSCTALNTWTPAGGVSPTPASIPGEAGLNAIPVTSGLMAEYRMLPTETPSGLLDYSGLGRNATGPVGAAPTIIPVTGGISCAGAGAVNLPSALNSALTIQLFGAFQYNTAPLQVTQMLVGGNGANPIQLDLYASTTGDNWGPPLTGGYRIRSFSPGNTFKSASRDVFQGADVITFLMDATDRFFIGQTEVTYYQSLISAGLQTNGNHQLCGVTPNYLNGKIYYAVFYNRVLTNAEVASNVAYIRNAMAARAVPVSNGATDTQSELICDGDSLTSGGTNYCTAFTVPPPTTAVMQYLNPLTYNVADQGLNGGGTGILTTNIPTDTVSLFRPFGPSNIAIFWAGSNDTASGTIPYPNIRGYCQTVHALAPAAKCLPATMVSRTGLDFNKNALNDYLRRHWPEFADGLIDLAANPNLGADGASANATYFSDGVHLTVTGNNLVAAIAQQAILRVAGNTQSGAQPVVVPPQFQALQCATNFTGSSVSTLNVSLPSNTKAGSLVFLVVHGPGGGQTINAPTDTQAKTWTSVSAAVLSNGKNVQAYFAPNATAAAETITDTFGGSGVNISLTACEYSGVLAAAPLDAAAAILNTSAANPNASNSVTTTGAGELLITYGTVSNTLGFQPFNFTALGTSAIVPSIVRVQSSNQGSGQGVGTALADSLSGATGGYLGQLSYSGTLGNGSVGIAAFKIAATPLLTYQMTGADISINCLPTAGNTTITLPDAIGFTGQNFTIKNVQAAGANTCTVAGLGAETIDGAASVVVANKATLIVRSALTSPAAGGANWVQLQNN